MEHFVHRGIKKERGEKQRDDTADKHHPVIGLLLLFPDGETITGETLLAASINGGGMSQRTTLTNAQLNVYLEQGCVFLPGTGHYVNNGSRWENGGVMTGFYLTADVYDQMERYYINVWNENFNLDMRSRIESNLDNCDVLRLVRTAD